MDTLKKRRQQGEKGLSEECVMARVRGKRKIGQIAMEVWGSVEWTGLARMKAVAGLRLLSNLVL